MKVLKYIILQYILGVIFIASGITKLFSIDDFHVFVYSFQILNLNYSMILTRVLIGLELSIGLLFLFRIYSKSLSRLTFDLMTVFTIFSLYLFLSNSKEDCHCFGTFIQLSVPATILKNLIIILLVAFSFKGNPEKQYKYKKIILFCCLFLGFGASLAVRPPDFLYAKSYSSGSYYYKPALDKFTANNKLTDKKRMICFFSTGCKYCKLAAKKITVISEKTKNTGDILYVFWTANKSSTTFFNETNTIAFNHVDLNVIDFLKLTNGTMPLIVLYNKGVVENAYRYKDIDENQIIKFLNK